jgi:hypothetical protein
MDKRYIGLNLTTLQILEVLNSKTEDGSMERMNTMEIERKIYGSSLSGPQKDLFLTELHKVEERGYATKHTHDPHNNKLRYWEYELSDKGEKRREKAHEGFINVILPKSLVG